MINKRLLFLFFLLQTSVILAQDFMMQGWYWDYPKDGCNGVTNTWASVLQGQVNTIANAGFTYIWLPPPTNTSSGACSNGYDPKDLYDLGEFSGATGIGTRAELDNLISAFSTAGVNSVADVVFNHRDGGAAEVNPAVKQYITVEFDATTKSPYPSDRFFCTLPLGGSSGNGAGDYYFKISSKTGDAKFDFYEYKVYMQTGIVGWQGLPDDTNEGEPNGGGDCGQPFKTITLGRNFIAQVDEHTSCRTDEFKLTLTASDFNSSGDELQIYLNNTGSYSDHRIYGIWNASAGQDVIGQLEYKTWTDFTSMPSGQGSMNYENFRPNSGSVTTEKLDGFWNWPWWFYDYDQSVTGTKTAIKDWAKWLWNNANFRGYRMDAVKHFDYQFTAELLNDLHANGIDPGMMVGEFFDANPATLNTWIDDVYNNMTSGAQNNINIRLFDFAMRDALKNACDLFGYDVRNVFQSGMVDAAGTNSANVVTFLNNHDFRDAGQPVQNDPILAYAYLLTNNQIGLPCIYYPDFFGTALPNFPVTNMQTDLTELMNIHQNYIYQAGNIEYLSRSGTPFFQSFTGGYATTSLIYQIAGGIGGKDILVAINFAGEELIVEQGLNSDTDGDGTANFPPNAIFNELTSKSNSSSMTVDNNYHVNIRVPARSYAVWAQNAVLPIKEISLSSTPLKKEVLLTWKTKGEKNVRLFEIERSTDGVHFEKTGQKPAINGTNDTNTYHFTDRNPPLNQKLYYRIKVIDLDGSISYSSIVLTELKNNSAIRIYPNPAKSKLFIDMNGNALDAPIFHLYNLDGKEVLKPHPGSVSAIDVSTLSKGIYILAIESSRKQWVKKVVID